MLRSHISPMLLVFFPKKDNKNTILKYRAFLIINQSIFIHHNLVIKPMSHVASTMSSNFPHLDSIPEALLMVFLFHSWYVMLGFVWNINIVCSEDLFWLQSYWGKYILLGNFKQFNKISWSHRPCSQIWHMLKGLFTNCGLQLFIVIVMGFTCGTQNAHFFWKTWFWGISDFTHSLYINIANFFSLGTMSTDSSLTKFNDSNFVCLD